MGSKSRGRGKRGELAIGKFWCCKRNHFEADDLTGHPILSIECKVRQSPIKTISAWLAQAEAAKPDDKVAAVHFHVVGDQHSQDIIIMRATDLRDIVGKGVH